MSYAAASLSPLKRVVSAMITCKLTGQTGPAVKAHIVPESFYELPPQTDGPYRLITNTLGTHPKRVPIGIYDSTIVTRAGEDVFAPWDSYACELLLNQFDQFSPIRNGNDIIAWQLTGTDYAALKLFALSVLWRAHASSQPAFSKVKLGPHESRIRDILLRGDPGSEEQYSVCIVRWIDDGFGPVVMDPFRERYEGVNYYRIYCGRYVLYVKVDNLRTGTSFKDMQLAPGRDLFLIARELKRSKEWPVMKRVAHANER